MSLDWRELQKEGKRLGRRGLSERVLDLTSNFLNNPSYIEAIILIGRMKALAHACNFDSYWQEKMNKGYGLECYDLRKYQEPPKDFGFFEKQIKESNDHR